MESLWVGLTGTGIWDDTHLAKNWDQKYSQLFPRGKARLNEILSLMKAEQADKGPEFFWWEDIYQAQGCSITGVYKNAGLTVPYGAGDDLPAGSVVYVKVSQDNAKLYRPNLEVMLRSSGDLRNDIVGKIMDVTFRGASSSVAVKLLENDGSGPSDLSSANYMFVMGDVNPQSGFPPVSRFRERVYQGNNCQIFKETYDWSRTEGQTEFKTGDKKKEKKAQALLRFNEFREHCYLWGKKTHTVNSDNGLDEYTTGGIVPFIKSGAPDNIRYFHLLDSTAYKGQTWIQKGKRFLDESMERLFEWTDGSQGKKLCLCGNGVISGLNVLAGEHSMFTMTERTTTFGWSVWTWRSPFGDVDFLTYPMFTLYGMSNLALFLEPHLIKRMYIQQTKHEDVTPKGMDGSRFQFLSEDGLKIKYPRTMMLLDGIGLDNTVA